MEDDHGSEEADNDDSEGEDAETDEASAADQTSPGDGEEDISGEERPPPKQTTKLTSSSSPLAPRVQCAPYPHARKSPMTPSSV